MSLLFFFFFFFFFNDTAPTEISPLPLHDALPISIAPAARASKIRCFIICYLSAPSPWPYRGPRRNPIANRVQARKAGCHPPDAALVDLGGIRGIDRKSTRLNSSHTVISYAVFCLK